MEGKFSKRICVSVFGRNLAQLENNATLAQSFDPGFIELRLDYLRSFSDLSQLKKFKGGRSARIFTLRSPGEGGVRKISDEVRKQRLLEIITQLRPSLVDVELSTLETNPEIQDIFNGASSRSTQLIASSHNFERTERVEDLETIVMTAVLQYHPAIIKIVRQANNFNDNLTMLSLYRQLEKIKPVKLIAFCTGPLGMFSRIACVSYGSPFTYAALQDRETASGQLDVRSMKILLESWELKRR